MSAVRTIIRGLTSSNPYDRSTQHAVRETAPKWDAETYVKALCGREVWVPELAAREVFQPPVPGQLSRWPTCRTCERKVRERCTR